jgi:rhodanese-related sulfurtransferase
MKTIAPAELDTLLRAQPDLPLLDVRTPMEYAQVHVPQARNIPLDTLAPGSLFERGLLPRGQPIYILCQTGGRANKAAEQFAREGFDQAVVVEGGTKAWSDAGLPVDRGAGKTISLERQVRIGAGSLVLLGVILSYFVHPYFVGLSAFVGAGLVFAGISDWCGMGLLIAKAPWNKDPRA